MELELTYNPNNSEIDIVHDIQNVLHQLSECYNEKIRDLENKIKGYELERAAIRKAYLENNINGLDFYFK